MHKIYNERWLSVEQKIFRHGRQCATIFSSDVIVANWKKIHDMLVKEVRKVIGKMKHLQ
ncbi:MAG: hypothetical protein ACR5KV_07510 [Wolbachia sp.]